MAIRTYLDLSTAHVEQKDMDMLNFVSRHILDGYPIAYAYEEGAFIPMPPFTDEDKARFRQIGFSDAFINLLNFAAKQGCDLIRLDRDGYETDDLPRFDW